MPLPNTSILIHQLDGSTRSTGRVSVQASIDTRTETLTLHVLPRFTQPLLLGVDALTKFGIVLDFSQPAVQTRESHDRCYASQRDVIEELSKRFPVFAKDDNDIGLIPIDNHVIRTKPDARPHYAPPIRMSIDKRRFLQRWIADALSKGIIRKSLSPHAYRMFVVRKKNNSWRPVVDYRPLNENTISERWPLPIIGDLIDEIATGIVFSMVDIAWAYHHVAIDPDSIEKTAFITPDGHYEYLRLPFGLKNAPATFQRIIARVIEGLPNVRAYLDDIVVFTANEAEHSKALERLFQRLARNNLRLRHEKCVFFAREIEYLGHVITNRTVRPAPSKTTSITNYPKPTNATEVRQFVGLANYYRQFTPRMSELAEPLTQLTRKNTKFEWTASQQNAFDEIKRALASEPILASFDRDRKTELVTDASTIGIGAILQQRDVDGQPHVVAYWSRRLLDTETRYSSVELECLAVVKSVNAFRHYLEGIQFKIVTDCAALKWLVRAKDGTNSRLFRWSARLSAYDYEITHRPGKRNQAADALSRNLPTTFTATRNETANEPSSPVITLDLPGVDTEQTNERRRETVPKGLRHAIIEANHDSYNHPGVRATIRLIREKYHWRGYAKDVANYVQNCRTCQLAKASRTTDGIT